MLAQVVILHCLPVLILLSAALHTFIQEQLSQRKKARCADEQDQERQRQQAEEIKKRLRLSQMLDARRAAKLLDPRPPPPGPWPGRVALAKAQRETVAWVVSRFG